MKERFIAKQQNTIAKKLREQDAKRKSEEKLRKRILRQERRDAKHHGE